MVKKWSGEPGESAYTEAAMTVMRSPLIACTALALALAVAAPAAALSGYPVSSSLHDVTLAAKTKAARTAHTCQAGRNHAKAGGKTDVSDLRNTPVVACEQPPRSEVVIPSLKQTAASTLAAYG